MINFVISENGFSHSIDNNNKFYSYRSIEPALGWQHLFAVETKEGKSHRTTFGRVDPE